MNPSPDDITFVIPVRNDARRLSQCLLSIAESKLPAASAEIIVVDNGSTDGSAAVALAAAARVLTLPDMSVAALRNRGAAMAHGNVLAFVDADHEIAAEWASVALEALSSRGVAAVGAPYCAPRSPTWVQRLYDAFRDHQPGTRDAAWLGAGNLAVNRDVFAELGGFDEALEACEDVDFCQRLRRAGYRLLADSRLRSVHHGDPPTLGALFRSELWRGRNNLRVSLRGPLSPAAMPSLVIPMLHLACIGIVVVGLASAGRTGMALAAAGFAAFAVLSALRAACLLVRLRPKQAGDAVRAFGVAATYDAARALALMLQVPHRRARRTSPAQVHQS